jgi:hypothetical protein
MTGVPGHDSDVRRAVAKVTWAGLGPESWNRTNRSGQTGQESRVRTGHLEQDIWNWTTGQDSQDMTMFGKHIFLQNFQGLRKFSQKCLQKRKFLVNIFTKMFGSLQKNFGFLRERKFLLALT